MRRILFALLVAFGVVAPALASAATWSYFLHPRPVTATVRGLARPMGVSSAIAGSGAVIDWEFHPTVALSASAFRGKPGGGSESDLLSAAGPALTLQHTTVTGGVSHADYAVNLALLLDGHTTQAPSINPALALTFGTLNNIVNFGVGYDLTQRSDGLGRTFVLVGAGINLTNN